VAAAGLLLLPAGLMAFFAFNSGGFYPGPPAFAAVMLCVVLVLRTTMARDPLEGVGWPLAIAAGALALFALLTLVSGAWSHAPGRALVEFDLPVLYLLAMVLFGSVARTADRLRWMLRFLAVAITAVCACGLITRLLPNLWHTSSQIADNRLSFPVTYWNALGLLAVLGIVLCMHLSSDLREPRAWRVLATAAVPLLATTLFFTFSRGSIATGVIALTVYVLLGRPRGLASSLLATVPPTVIALAAAYGANRLATHDPTTPQATLQGHGVAATLLGCVLAAAALRAVLLVLDRRLLGVALRPGMRRPLRRLAWASLATVTLLAAVSLNGAIAHQYHRFMRPTTPGNTADLRARLTDPGNNGRVDMWRVAWHQFTAAPVLGAGAGTFANTWAQRRPTTDAVADAHSLYMEVLDELGIVGLLLLLTAMFTVLGVAAARARGPHRPLYAAILAVLLALAVHAGMDWDWEMPVLTVVFFALGGAVLARPASEPRHAAGPGPQARVLIGIGCALLAAAPASVWLSQRKLDQAAQAFSQHDCRSATAAAQSSISILGSRPEPYEILGYCDARGARPLLAIAAINKAISLDPQNWNYTYDLALVRAEAGLNPRSAARRALALDPLEPLTRQAWSALRIGDPQQWQVRGRTLVNQATL